VGPCAWRSRRAYLLATSGWVETWRLSRNYSVAVATQYGTASEATGSSSRCSTTLFDKTKRFRTHFDPVATDPRSDFVLRTVGGISNCIGTEFYQRITLSIRIVSRRLPLPELTTDSATKHFSPVAIALSTLEKRGAVGTHARARKPFELITGAFRFVFHVVLAQTQFTLNRSSPATSLLLLQPRCVPLHNPVWELRKVWSLSAF